MEIIINESQLRKLVNEQTESGGVWDYVFGDSIANGLNGIAKADGWQKPGANPKRV